MNFSFEKPYAFFAILILIPVWFFVLFRLKSLVKLFSTTYVSDKTSASYAVRHFKSLRLFRLVIFSITWIFLAFAYAGFSWGTALVPVQKSGNSVCLVFDISYSMMAQDAPEGLTRLEAAVHYAEKLLEQLPGTSFSVVIAKGDGVILIPQTEDQSMVKMALQNINPRMMSSSGSSLGKGIRSAIKSFPTSISQFQNIWIFTDGDETDGLLTSSITDALKMNIPVTIIGFGSEREIEITAGDGKTAVRTALKAQEMKDSASLAMKRSGIGYSDATISARYVDASETGSALSILRPLKREKIFGKNNSFGSENELNDKNIIMEMQRVYRRGIFLAFALITFILGFFVSEFNVRQIKDRFKVNKKGKTISALCVFVMLMFSSCNIKLEGAKDILQSTWAWHQQNYRKATAGFFQVKENAVEDKNVLLEQYALYGLATTYMMQDENEAALTRFEEIKIDAPDDIRFASSYNLGIIAHRNGNFEEAVYQFKNALLIKPTNISAKINLEVSLQQYERKQSDATDRTTVAVPQAQEKTASSVEEAVFNQIQENEQNQWKNQQSQESDNSVIDY